MTIDAFKNNTQILEEIGLRIKTARIRRELTQADLAHKCGVSKGTVENIEKGQSVQLTSLLNILRELDCLNSLDILLPSTEKTPMELIREKQVHYRTRYRKSEIKKENTKWEWND